MQLLNRFAVATCAIALLNPASIQAQPRPTERVLEIRVRSVNDLFDRAEYLGDLVEKGEPIKQIHQIIKSRSKGGKGIEGVDPTKPFGIYALLSPDVASSPVIVMVPVADEKTLLAAIHDHLAIDPEKLPGGTLKFNAPLVNELYVRFANGYLYAARTANDLDAKSLLTPEAFFTKDDGSVASVLVKIDQIPPDLRKLFLGQFEHQVQEQLKKDAAGKPAGEVKVASLFVDGMVSSLTSLFEEGKSIALRLVVDPKSDELSIEAIVTPKEGTDLAKNTAGIVKRMSLPAGIVGAGTASMRSSSRMLMTDTMRDHAMPVIDGILEDIVKHAKPEEQELTKRVMATLAPTLKSGEFDVASKLLPANEKGHQTLISAIVVKDGNEMEKLAKDISQFLPANEAQFTFDIERIGPFSLHKLEFKGEEKELDKVFGTKTVWLGVSDDCIAFSIEPDGAVLKAGLKAKPAATPVMGVDLSLARLVALFEKELKPDEIKAIIKDALGADPQPKKDTVSLRVEGGNQLTIRVKVDGKAIRLVALINDFKKK